MKKRKLPREEKGRRKFVGWPLHFNPPNSKGMSKRYESKRFEFWPSLGDCQYSSKV